MERVALFGATSAIASAMAIRYAARGASLYLLGRSGTKLADLADRLDGQTGQAGTRGQAGLHQQIVDFSACDAPALVQHVIEALGGLDTAVIAHGDLGDQLKSEHDITAATAIFEANLLSVVRLLIPLANHFEAQRRGHLAVLSSVAGERGRPRNYTYGAAKSAVTTYMQGVRSRLWPEVGVHTFKLGPVDSPMTAEHPKNPLFASPDQVAQAAIRHIDQGTGEAYVPWYWQPIMGTVERLPEAVFQRFKFLAAR